MEHVVFYTGHDGLPSFRRVESLTDAVSLVEHLRNSQGKADMTVFALSAYSRTAENCCSRITLIRS